MSLRKAVPRERHRRRVLVISALIAGGLAIILFALQSDDPVGVLALGLMLSGAASAVGGLLGFLFGVPRTPTANDANSHAENATVSVNRHAYRANTNLEQISDWLTKILVGIGLTQVAAIHRFGSDMLDTVAPALGGGALGKTFGAALLTYFSLFGFMVGWIATRLQLAPALSEADYALQTFVKAEVEHKAGNEENAEQLRDEAVQMLIQASVLPRSYDRLRSVLPSGTARTAAMEGVIASARRAGASGVWLPNQVTTLFDTGVDGDRVYSLGLMQGDTGLADSSRILEAVTRPRSRFEQYHALHAGFQAMAAFDEEVRTEIASVIRAQIADGRIPIGSERILLAQRILKDIEH